MVKRRRSEKRRSRYVGAGGCSTENRPSCPLGKNLEISMTGTVSRAQTLKGWFVMVKDSKNIHPGNSIVGRRLGLVVVRCRQSFEDHIDKLQSGLPILPCTGARYRLDLCPRVSPADAGGRHSLELETRQQRFPQARQRERLRGTGNDLTAGPRVKAETKFANVPTPVDAFRDAPNR